MSFVVNVFTSFLFWGSGIGPLWAVRPCEGVRVGSVGGGCVLDEVCDRHGVKGVVGDGVFHRDEDAAEGRSVGRGYFSRVLDVGVGLVHGAGQGDDALGRIHCKVGDVGGGDGTGDVLSHGGVSFSFV